MPVTPDPSDNDRDTPTDVVLPVKVSPAVVLREPPGGLFTRSLTTGLDGAETVGRSYSETRTSGTVAITKLKLELVNVGEQPNDPDPSVYHSLCVFPISVT